MRLTPNKRPGLPGSGGSRATPTCSWRNPAHPGTEMGAQSGGSPRALPFAALAVSPVTVVNLRHEQEQMLNPMRPSKNHANRQRPWWPTHPWGMRDALLSKHTLPGAVTTAMHRRDVHTCVGLCFCEYTMRQLDSQMTKKHFSLMFSS